MTHRIMLWDDVNLAELLISEQGRICISYDAIKLVLRVWRRNDEKITVP